MCHFRTFKRQIKNSKPFKNDLNAPQTVLITSDFFSANDIEKKLLINECFKNVFAMLPN